MLDKKSGKGKMVKESEDKAKKPPKVIGAYFYFQGEFIPDIKKKEGISHREAMSRAGKEWGQMTEEDKKPFEKMQEKDQKRYPITNSTTIYRYDKQLEELKEKGYYIRADGTKSTDVEESGKKRQSKAVKGKKKSTAKESANKSKMSQGGKKGGNRKSAKSKKDESVDEDEGELDIEGDDD